MNNTLTLDDTNFESTISESTKPILVDFWAEWCGPCRVVSPIVDELAEEYNEQMTFAKLNVDLAPEAARTYQVMSIPTLIIYVDGKEAKRLIGSRTKGDFVNELQEYL